MADSKTCPFCAEAIRSEATFCRFCRSRLAPIDTADWHRNHAEARLAGVCAALAHAFALPVALVRLGFVFFTIFLHVGVFAYIGLWLLIPPAPGQVSYAEGALQWGLDMLRGSDADGKKSDRPSSRQSIVRHDDV